MEGIINRVATELGVPETQRLSFWSGVMQNSKVISDGPGNLGKAMAQLVENGGSYHVLGVRVHDDKYRVVYRTLTAAGVLNYHEIELGRDPFGDVVADDHFSFNSGEALSLTLRCLVLPSLIRSSPMGLDGLKSSDRESVLNADKIRQYATLVAARKFDDADLIYQALPVSVRSHGAVLVMRLRTASERDRRMALSECQQTHPRDSDFDLLALQDAIDRSDKNSAFEAVDRLEQRLGNDPCLDLVRSMICKNAGDLDGSERFAGRAIDSEPGLKRYPQITVGR